MYHCHILEHHAAGMMAHFDVLPAQDSAGSANAALAHAETTRPHTPQYTLTEPEEIHVYHPHTPTSAPSARPADCSSPPPACSC